MQLILPKGKVDAKNIIPYLTFSGTLCRLLQMELIINSESENFNQPLTVEQLIYAKFNELPKGIAIAVNNQVIPRDNWKNFDLKNGNKILIIKATQGG